MQTIYLDVYFLINFSVDALALYFAIRVTKIKGTLIRLILSSAILSAAACLMESVQAVSLLRYKSRLTIPSEPSGSLRRDLPLPTLCVTKDLDLTKCLIALNTMEQALRIPYPATV